MLVDSHAHLDDRRFDDDREEVIARAAAAGLGALLTVGVDLESSRAAVALAQQHAGIYAAAGIHPHEASRADAAALSALEKLCCEDKVVAVGEIGFDFFYKHSTVDEQRTAFVAQLQIARRLHKPVIIHDRDAHAESMDVLREHGRGLRGVLHCFSGDRAMALAAIELGFYISFAGPVTFTNARGLQALAAELPLERMFVETDCPYLTPHPFRGQRNEPARVALVAAKIAELRGLAEERVAAVTAANAAALFGLPLGNSGSLLPSP